MNMNEVKNLFKSSFFPLLIFFLVTFVSYKNYVPGTILSGWDTLHPEFNFSLYLKRIFFGVWQEHQGVGALASQSHASEISRMPLLFLLYLVLPLNLVRYFFFGITLLLGTLGTYFAFLVFVKKDSFYAKIAAFVGALAYLLNLYTVGQYYVPLEMFAVYFAFVPWLFFALTLALDTFDRKRLLFFAFVAFFSSSMAHTPTLFYTFSLCFLSYFVFYLIFNFSLETFKKLFIIGLVYLGVNLFWILPSLYFLKSGGDKIVESSRIHLNFTPEAFLQSKAFGDLGSLVLGKSFLFNWREFSVKENTFVDLLDEWEVHLSRSYIYELSFGLILLSFLGFIFSVFSRQKKVALFLSPLLISTFFLLNENPPLGSVFSFLRNNYPALREALRFPFTKFSFTFTFPLAIFLSFFVYSLFNFCFKVKVKLLRFGLLFLSFIFYFLISFAIFYRSLPAFNGYLISPSMKVRIPDEYFQVFKWFSNKNENLRIAKLPLQTHWGWGFYKWDYQGAGFTWFGLKQATFDREFDRWSPYNETFYNEASNVLYKYNLVDLDKDGPCQGKKECGERNKAKEKIEEWNLRVVREFESILSKYNVSYLLLDESILNAGGDEKLLFIPQIKDLISHSSGIKEAAKFGFLTVYEFSGTGSDPVQAPKEYVEVDANLTYSKYDFIYQKYGEYINYQEGKGKITGYPFVNFDPRGDVKISLRKTIDGQNQLVFENNRMNAKVVLPVSEAIEEKFGEDQGFKEGYNCDLKKKGTAIKNRLAKGNFYAALEGGVSCDWFYYPQVSRSKAYVLRIKGKNLKGRSLKIYFQNLRTGRMDLEELLPQGSFDSYFVIFPTEPDLSEAGSQELIFGVQPGYTLNVETRSFGRIASENIIEDITFIPIDIDWLYQITSLSGDVPQEAKNNLQIASYKKYGTWGYKVETLGDGVLKLAQGYDEGWIAFGFQPSDIRHQLQNFKRFDHLKINGWANGWVVRPSVSQSSAIGDQIGAESYTIAIIYWPQLLEWGGFVFGFLVLLFLFLEDQKGNKNVEQREKI